MALSQENAVALCFQDNNPVVPLLTDTSSCSSTYISFALQGAKTKQGWEAEATSSPRSWSKCLSDTLLSLCACMQHRCSTAVQSYTGLTSSSVQECGACCTAGVNTEKIQSLTAMSVWMELSVFHHRGDCSCYCISFNFEQKVIRKVINWPTNSFLLLLLMLSSAGFSCCFNNNWSFFSTESEQWYRCCDPAVLT